MRGFDATSTSTQLQRVQSLASSATRSAALRASDGEARPGLLASR